jgi:hypothetical protein
MRKSPEPKKKTVTQQKNPRGGGRTRLGAVRYLWEGEGEIPKRWADTVELAIRRSTRCQRHGAVPLYGVKYWEPTKQQAGAGRDAGPGNAPFTPVSQSIGCCGSKDKR